MPLTLDPAIADRLLSDVVESPRARAALEKHGLKTLGDVAKRGIGSLHGLKHVGEATVSLIDKALGPIPVEEAESDGKIEEGVHPVRLESPYPFYRMSVYPARKVSEPGGGYALQDSLFIEFNRGEGVLSKEMWLMREHARDRVLVASSMADTERPWRAKAIAWLRAKDTFARGEFRILTD